MPKFKLGQIVQDKITKYQGVTMARADYLTGCSRYAILKTSIKEGDTYPEWVWFDETRLIEVSPDIIFDLEEEETVAKQEISHTFKGGGENPPGR